MREMRSRIHVNKQRGASPREVMSSGARHLARLAIIVATRQERGGRHQEEMPHLQQRLLQHAPSEYSHLQASQESARLGSAATD